MNVRKKDDIQELMGAHFPSAALNAALELGLFWLLEDGPKTTAFISRALNIPQKRCSYWLSVLAALNLLHQEGDHFNLSAVARSEILKVHSQETWKMLALDAQDNYDSVNFLAQRLVGSGQVEDGAKHPPPHLPSYVQHMAKDPERARLFSEMLFELHTPLARDIAAVLDLDGAGNLLDIGGGSAIVSIILLRKHAKLISTVVDIPNVCRAGREIAGKHPEGDRISFQEADFVRDELPQGFDLVLKCDVGQFDDPLLAKLALSVNEGGRLVIVDRWFDMGRQETPGRLAFLLRESLRDPDYSLRSLEDIEHSLVQAGLKVEKIVVLPYGAWKMIQARKIGGKSSNNS
jgi:hypothetical protein